MKKEKISWCLGFVQSQNENAKSNLVKSNKFHLVIHLSKYSKYSKYTKYTNYSVSIILE